VPALAGHAAIEGGRETDDLRVNLGAALPGMFEFFQDDDAASFADGIPLRRKS